jgi:diguanylate cyclase (GGDEF)-like protein
LESDIRVLPRRSGDLAQVILVAASYYVAGKFGLRLAFLHPSSTPVWPPTGIALAALLFAGRRVIPGIFLGAFLVNVTTAGSVVTSLGVAMGNTLEGVVGAFLVNRYANGRKSFARARDTFKFAILAGLLSTTVSATIGTTSISLGGYASWASFRQIWLTWWLGDAAGNLVFAPFLILWLSNARLRWSPVRLLELVVLMGSLIFAAEVVFGGSFVPGARNYPLEYLCIPFLMWAAIRFGQREAATATLVLSVLAIWGTLHGFGPFVRASPNVSLLLLQAFMGVVAVMTIGLAALSAERQRAEDWALHLAVTDPLTGLANHRRLLEVLGGETERGKRTGRSFAVVLLDLDGLKQVNDKYGHLTGSRALCRLAEVLRLSCRNVDTAARCGGDEFAVVIPGGEAATALEVAHRVRERLAQDSEMPPLSVSTGTAVYPDNGDTTEKLLAAADRALYAMKEPKKAQP